MPTIDKERDIRGVHINKEIVCSKCMTIDEIQECEVITTIDVERRERNYKDKHYCYSCDRCGKEL